MSYFDEFGKKWASEGSIEPISETKRKSGWDFLGAVPPLSGQFNQVQQSTDQKINYLFDLINAFALSRDSALTEDDTNKLRDILNTAINAGVKIADLSSDIGALMVGIKYAGVGANLRTVRDSLIDMPVSLKGFGNYTTDASNSLALAIASGKRAWIPSDITSIGVKASDVYTILKNLWKIDPETDLTLTLPAGVHTTAIGDIALVGKNQSIKIQGAPTVDSTITGVSSVTGSLGDWAVTFDLADASGMAVGDVLRIHDVLPGRSHYSTAFTGVRNAIPGEIAIGFNFMGNISVTAGATSFSVTKATVASYIAVGDLIHVRGQSRVVTTVTASGGTVDAAWEATISSQQWWYFTKPGAGTLSEGGTIVNGAGTAFLTALDVGDIIFAQGEMRKVTAVNTDTQFEVTHAISLVAGTPYSIIKAGLLHEGSFEITAIVGNSVTVRNRSRYAKPPATGIIGGTAKAIKTVLKNTAVGGHGLKFQEGGILGSLRDVALQGRGASNAGTGILLNGTTLDSNYPTGNGRATLEGSCAVLDWARGAFLSAGAVLIADDQHINNNFDSGIECTDGADAYLRTAVINHNNDLGMILSGGYARTSGARFCGNLLQGTRQDVSSGIYGDTWYTWGNGSHGVMLVGMCGIQYVDSFAMANGGNGVNFQNGAGGRVSRTLFACNANYGINITNGKLEATQIWATGALPGYGGVNASKSEIDLVASAETGNATNGIYGQAGSRIDARDSFQSKNTTGVRADDFGTVIDASTSYASGNATDYQKASGGDVATPLTLFGSKQAGSHYAQASLAIADDSVYRVYCGSNLMILTLASLSTGLHGQVRARTGAGAASSLMYGAGITVTTGVLTGTTGADGDFTVSVATDGYLYIENRLGTARSITFDLIGRIS